MPPLTPPLADLRAHGAVLLISCYELGHQPLGLASPSEHLHHHGYRPRLLDLAVETIVEDSIREARFVGISVPMHTALSLGVRVARHVRRLNPACHLCFYGLYAPLNEEFLLQELADSIIGGEYEIPLINWLHALERGTAEPVEGVSIPQSPQPPWIGRGVSNSRVYRKPRRENLPPLDRYAHLEIRGQQVTAGSVETTRGCRHRCLHCPITPIYGGRFFVVPREIVLEDVRALVARGAMHITFGDPDFLNGPGHSMAVARDVHEEFPQVTFDITAKVEHLLRYPHLLPELSALGCLFVVSAVESLSDLVLSNLDKGHSKADVAVAVRLVSDAGMALRPSLLPFTPWSTLEDYLELLDFIVTHRLVGNIDPVQLTIRLLVPPGSALLGTPQFEPYRGPLDPEAFTYRWEHPDPLMDRLQEIVAALVERAAEESEAPELTFGKIRQAAQELAGIPSQPEDPAYPPFLPGETPRLSEPWFC